MLGHSKTIGSIVQTGELYGALYLNKAIFKENKNSKSQIANLCKQNKGT